jgi:uncharacterized coiled-coil protein SlyX
MSEANERLASLETRVSLVIDMLKEIKQDVKNQPSRAEFLHLETQVKSLTSKAEFKDLKSEVETLYADVIKLRDKVTSQMIRIGIATGVLGAIGGALLQFFVSKI